MSFSGSGRLLEWVNFVISITVGLKSSYNIVKSIFWWSSIFLFNIVAFKVYITIKAVIHYFDIIFVLRFLVSLKIALSFDDYLVICADLFSSEHIFEICKQKKKVTGSQIWAILWKVKQFVAFFSHGALSYEPWLFHLQMGLFFYDFILQTLKQHNVIIAVNGLALFKVKSMNITPCQPTVASFHALNSVQRVQSTRLFIRYDSSIVAYCRNKIVFITV